jgi:hypothetical protein
MTRRARYPIFCFASFSIIGVKTEPMIFVRGFVAIQKIIKKSLFASDRSSSRAKLRRC